MISMIVAADENNAIGYQNKLLCRLKDDMKHFVQTTVKKPVIMGYNTFESLNGVPLKDRWNLVLSSNPLARYDKHLGELIKNDDLIIDDLDEINSLMEEFPLFEFMVIGGQMTYELFLPRTDRIYLTRIHHGFKKADAFFPSLNEDEWQITKEQSFEKNENNDHPFTIFQMDRKVTN